MRVTAYILNLGDIVPADFRCSDQHIDRRCSNAAQPQRHHRRSMGHAGGRASPT